jgi:hypothetical protein
LTQFSATFNFEAESLEAAEQIVGGWTVTAGTTLISLSGMVMSRTAPVVVSTDGPISEGESKAVISDPAVAPSEDNGAEAT